VSRDAHAVRRGLAVLLVTVIASPVALRAEPLYVIEQLVVAVSSAPDPSGERVATLKSGERVEMLERAGEQVHVRLANGREGWVRASYLSADEPLRVRLAQRDAELARLNDEVSLLKAQPRAAPAAAGGAAAAAATATAAAEDPATPPPGALFSAGEERPRPLWPWTLAAALIGCGIGFGLGAFMLDRHIRRKYGGLRIY
jgi:SH3-like domain-containing protein